MRTKAIVIILLACIFHTSTQAQWRLIASLNEWSPFYQDSIADDPTCAYFIDLPGPPRIGFAGTDAGIWKTSDGGNSWKKIPVYGYGFIENICFKDSLMGWFVATGGGSSTGGLAGSTLYRTSDGGDTWNWDSISGTLDNAEKICYVPRTNRLFISIDSSILVSTDLGDTWRTVLSLDSATLIDGFSFSTDLIGYSVAIGPPDYNHPYNPIPMHILRTFDGGLSWQSAEINAYTLQPLAIPGTSTCFIGSVYYVWRSDDYGETWRVIAYPDSSGWQPSTPIMGDLSRLYVQGTLGMFVSTDGGYTWENEGEPSYNYSGLTCSWYADKGIIVAGMTYTGSNDMELGGGLWEEVWPQSSVALSNPSQPPGVSIFPNPTTGLVTIYGDKVDVLNILGENVLTAGGLESRQNNSSKISLDISQLPSGIYFARIVTAYGEVQTVKLVKK